MAEGLTAAADFPKNAVKAPAKNEDLSPVGSAFWCSCVVQSKHVACNRFIAAHEVISLGIYWCTAQYIGCPGMLLVTSGLLERRMLVAVQV